MTLYAAQTPRDRHPGSHLGEDPPCGCFSGVQLEFKQHVERLARDGSDLQPYTCWTHGVEVCHSPYVLATGTDSDRFAPLPKMPCCADDCKRCAAHLGGLSSLGSACGIAGVSCCLPMWRPAKLGTTTTSTKIASTCCWWQPTRTSRWRQTLCPKISTGCSSGAQRVTLGSWAWEKYLTSGVPGSGAACSSSAAWMAGRAGLRHTATWHCLH